MEAAYVHPLRAARTRHNLTIERLAEAAKVGASTIWRAEHSYPINAESRHRLCTYLGMTSEELGLVPDRREKSTTVARRAIHASGESAAPLVSQAGHAPVVFHHMPDAFFHQAQALSEQDVGAWLAWAGNDLAALFDAGWTLESVLDALRVVLKGVQGMAAPMRRGFFQTAEAAIMSHVSLPTREHLTLEERERLGNALRKSVADGWQLFHTARPAHVLAVAQAQLYLLQQTHAFVEHDLRCSLYAALYDLIGAALWFQGHSEAAQRAYEKAHIAALEGGDIWNMAQSLNWQSVVANGAGKYAEAIRSIEAALRLLVNKDHEDYLRLKAHLLADWAYNAALLQNQVEVQEKLDASIRFLDGLGPNEEFDLARWHQITGNCLLMLGKYTAAIDHLEQSLAQLPSQWLARRLLTLVPLAEAYARQQERDASIATAERLALLLPAADSTMLNQRFLEYQQVLSHTFPRDPRVRAFIAGSRQRLIHATSADTKPTTALS
jgi:tetratricopeptide (TPR) repeat protein/transcriptional regulator with XRE-family HTH domain